MSEEWPKRRELGLAAPDGVLAAKWKGVTLHDAIERYMHEFPQGKACRRRDRNVSSFLDQQAIQTVSRV
ncbi:MAG: hypothetical protein CME75_04540 [Halomonas sp.]|nr:hypothetical protein [Halomonas sp.]